MGRIRGVHGAHPAWLRYGAAAVVVLLAAALAAALRSPLAPSPLAPYFAAVALAAWFGGAGPGAVAAVLSLAPIALISLPPFGSFAVDPARQSVLVVFAVVSALLVLLGLDRDRAERTARAAEHRLRRAQEAAGVGLWDWEAASGRTFWSDGMWRLYGLEPGAEAGDAIWLPRLHADDRSRVEAAVAAFLTSPDAEYADEFRIALPDGSERWLASIARAERDRHGRAVRMSGANLDVTARRRAADDLRASEERLRLAVEANRMVTWEWEPATDRITVGANFAEVYGLPALAGAAEGFALVWPDDLPAHRTKVERVARDGGGYRSEFRITRPGDGRVAWLEEHATALLDAAGRVERVVGVVLDATERRQGEDERVAFLDGLAHDVRNPLGAAKGHAQLARRRLRGAIDAARLEANLEGVETAVDRATALIDELLDTARLRAGQPLTLRLAPVDLVALAEQTAAESRASAADRDVRVEAAEPALAIDGDEARLRRVLGNLLDNAVKYSPDGSPVLVRVARAETGRWATVAVRDEGIGIPAADLPGIFDRFRRGGNAMAFAGAGIGLAGARQIAEQHGGGISVDSAEGAGSTFTLRLPLPGA